MRLNKISYQKAFENIIFENDYFLRFRWQFFRRNSFFPNYSTMHSFCIHLFRVLLDIRHNIASSRLASHFVDFPPILAIPMIILRACTCMLYEVLLQRLPYVRTRFRINAKREYSLERNNRVPNAKIN